MLKMSYEGCPGPSPATLAQFTLTTRAAAGNRQKFTKNSYFEGSRSSTLTQIKSLSLLLVIISSMSVPICNRFHATRDNCGKIATFRRVAVFDAHLRWPP